MRSTQRRRSITFASRSRSAVTSVGDEMKIKCSGAVRHRETSNPGARALRRCSVAPLVGRAAKCGGAAGTSKAGNWPLVPGSILFFTVALVDSAVCETRPGPEVRFEDSSSWTVKVVPRAKGCSRRRFTATMDLCPVRLLRLVTALNQPTPRVWRRGGSGTGADTANGSSLVAKCLPIASNISNYSAWILDENSYSYSSRKLARRACEAPVADSAISVKCWDKTRDSEDGAETSAR